MKHETNRAEIYAVLAATGDRPIVEVSTRNPWWGARPVTDRYEGENLLGRIWMELRQQLRDHDLAADRARRDPVLKAQPSTSAKRKKTERQTEEGLPIQSFATLMAEMGTRARHRCRMASGPDGPRLQRLTEPIPLQQRALELVKVFPVDK